MSVRLIYLDQNVVGLQAEHKINYAGISGIQWVYSKEHFSEIKRSSNPYPYLDALDQLNASLLEIDLKKWKFSGSATLAQDSSARRNYENYLESLEDVPVDITWLAVLMAWLNGGASVDAVLRVPDIFEEQLVKIFSKLPVRLDTKNICEVSSEFRRTLAEMVSHGNNIEQTRAALGVGKGAAGGIKGEDPIREIWKLVSPNVPGQTCDQFFGFDPIDALGQYRWTDYEAIIRCCAMLDIVGYQAEKKIRDPEKIENVMSDAAHIASAAYCSGVISTDKRFSRRAKAIYKYKKIATVSMILTTDK